MTSKEVVSTRNKGSSKHKKNTKTIILEEVSWIKKINKRTSKDNVKTEYRSNKRPSKWCNRNNKKIMKDIYNVVTFVEIQFVSGIHEFRTSN